MSAQDSTDSPIHAPQMAHLMQEVLLFNLRMHALDRIEETISGIGLADGTILPDTTCLPGSERPSCWTCSILLANYTVEVMEPPAPAGIPTDEAEILERAGCPDCQAEALQRATEGTTLEHPACICESDDDAECDPLCEACR